MSSFLVATHEATLTRPYLCKRCHASGMVSVQGVGTHQRDVHHSREVAAARAHDGAADALQLDGDRIVGLVKCPACGEQAPGAATASALRMAGEITAAFVIAAFLGAGAGTMVSTVTRAYLPIGAVVGAIVLVVALASSGERRRRSEAARADIELTKEPVDATPFREPPRVIAAAFPPPPGVPSQTPTLLR